MPDIVDKATRSRMMAGIRGKNTRPELSLRKALHRRGFRYSLHSANVFGRPDLVLPAYSAVVFVHGCFWHGHNCRFFHWPDTRREFWQHKIEGNQMRDKTVRAELKRKGWRQLIVWECAIRGKSVNTIDVLADHVAAWLRSGATRGSFSGR